MDSHEQEPASRVLRAFWEQTVQQRRKAAFGLPSALLSALTRRLAPTLRVGTFLGIAFTTSLHAQPLDQAERWYQVEVVLFAQTDNFGNEKNLKSVQLGYPQPQVFLETATEIAPETLARLSPEDLQLYLAMVPEALLQRRDPSIPVPFAALPPGDHLLTGEVRNLERSGSYQVLFHQAWRQTLGGPRNSPWVIIQGGNPVGDHYELEGSLRIYSATQIVAQTNLWRTRFGHNPRVNNHTGHDAARLDPTAPAAAKNGQPNASDWPLLPPAPRPPEPQLPALFREASSPAAFAIDAQDTAALHPARPATRPALAVVDIDRFETSQIINTRELHYLDHPRLGALIRVVPYDPEQPEEDLFDDLPLEDSALDLEAPAPEIDDEVWD